MLEIIPSCSRCGPKVVPKKKIKALVNHWLWSLSPKHGVQESDTFSHGIHSPDLPPWSRHLTYYTNEYTNRTKFGVSLLYNSTTGKYFPKIRDTHFQFPPLSEWTQHVTPASQHTGTVLSATDILSHLKAVKTSKKAVRVTAPEQVGLCSAKGRGAEYLPYGHFK